MKSYMIISDCNISQSEINSRYPQFIMKYECASLLLAEMGELVWSFFARRLQVVGVCDQIAVVEF